MWEELFVAHNNSDQLAVDILYFPKLFDPSSILEEKECPPKQPYKKIQNGILSPIAPSVWQVTHWNYKKEAVKPPTLFHSPPQFQEEF